MHQASSMVIEFMKLRINMFRLDGKDGKLVLAFIHVTLAVLS